MGIVYTLYEIFTREIDCKTSNGGREEWEFNCICRYISVIVTRTRNWIIWCAYRCTHCCFSITHSVARRSVAVTFQLNSIGSHHSTSFRCTLIINCNKSIIFMTVLYTMCVLVTISHFIGCNVGHLTIFIFNKIDELLNVSATIYLVPIPC